MVFVIEKSLIIIMFFYASAFCLLGAQFIWADVFHITMTNFQGQPLKNNLLNDIHTNTFNTVSNTVIQTNQTTVGFDAIAAAANIAWDLILLISGTYIFDLLLQLGVPGLFVALFVGLYIFLLARSILGWIRGI